MSILIEGPDGSGKSTLAQWLGGNLEWPIFHGGGPPKTRTDALDRIGYLLREEHGVFDRNTLISEQVYSRAMGRDPLLTDEELDQLMVEAVRKGILFVYCRPRAEVLLSKRDEGLGRKKSHKEPGHVEAVRKNYERVIELYDEVFDRLEVRHGAVVLRYAWEVRDVRAECTVCEG